MHQGGEERAADQRPALGIDREVGERGSPAAGRPEAEGGGAVGEEGDDLLSARVGDLGQVVAAEAQGAQVPLAGVGEELERIGRLAEAGEGLTLLRRGGGPQQREGRGNSALRGRGQRIQDGGGRGAVEHAEQPAAAGHAARDGRRRAARQVHRRGDDDGVGGLDGLEIRRLAVAGRHLDAARGVAAGRDGLAEEEGRARHVVPRCVGHDDDPQGAAHGHADVTDVVLRQVVAVEGQLARGDADLAEGDREGRAARAVGAERKGGALGGAPELQADGLGALLRRAVEDRGRQVDGLAGDGLGGGHLDADNREILCGAQRDGPQDALDALDAVELHGAPVRPLEVAEDVDRARAAEHRAGHGDGGQRVAHLEGRLRLDERIVEIREVPREVGQGGARLGPDEDHRRLAPRLEPPEDVRRLGPGPVEEREAAPRGPHAQRGIDEHDHAPALLILHRRGARPQEGPGEDPHQRDDRQNTQQQDQEVPQAVHRLTARACLDQELVGGEADPPRPRPREVVDEDRRHPRRQSPQHPRVHELQAHRTASRNRKQRWRNR